MRRLRETFDLLECGSPIIVDSWTVPLSDCVVLLRPGRRAGTALEESLGVGQGSK
jgi:hypothetical protein